MLAYSTIAQLSYVVMAAAVLKPLAEIGAVDSHRGARLRQNHAVLRRRSDLYVASKKTELGATSPASAGACRWTMTAFTIGALSA